MIAKLEGWTGWLYPTIAMLVCFLAWQLIGGALTSANMRIPLPSDILVSLVHDPSFYLSNSATTIFEAVAGFILAIVLSLAVASAFSLSPLARKVFIPIVIASQTIPLVAIAPLLAHLLGGQTVSRIVVAAWLCWFPAVISATHGMLNIDAKMLSLFEVYGANNREIYGKLRLPSSVASIVAGIRATAGFALIGAIVAEYSGGESGLGAFILAQSLHMNDATRLAGVIVIASLSGIALTETCYGFASLLLRKYLVSKS